VVALSLHVEGNARRDGRHQGGHAFRGRHLPRPLPPRQRHAEDRLERVRADFRAGIRLLGDQVRGVRMVSGIRTGRTAHAVHFRRLAARRRDLGDFPGRDLHRQYPHCGREDRPMTQVAMSPGTAALVLFGSFFILIALRVPVAFALGLACLPPLLFEVRLSPMVLFKQTFKSYNSFILLAVPFFLLTANLMNIGGITDRLVPLSRTMVGNWPGSLAQITVLLSVFFAGFSGSSTADAASQSKIFIPAQTKGGNDLTFSIANTPRSAGA